MIQGLNELATVSSIYTKLPITKKYKPVFDKIQDSCQAVLFIAEVLDTRPLATADLRIWATEVHKLAEEQKDKANFKVAYFLYKIAIRMLLVAPEKELSLDDRNNIMFTFEPMLAVKRKKSIPADITTAVSKFWNPEDAKNYPKIVKFLESLPLNDHAISSFVGSKKQELEQRIAQFKHYMSSYDMQSAAPVAESIADLYMDLADTASVESQQELLDLAQIYYLFVNKYQAEYRLDIDLSLLNLLEKKAKLGQEDAMHQIKEVLIHIPHEYQNHNEVIYYKQVLGRSFLS